MRWPRILPTRHFQKTGWLTIYLAANSPPATYPACLLFLLFLKRPVDRPKHTHPNSAVPASAKGSARPQPQHGKTSHFPAAEPLKPCKAHGKRRNLLRKTLARRMSKESPETQTQNDSTLSKMALNRNRA